MTEKMPVWKLTAQFIDNRDDTKAALSLDDVEFYLSFALFKDDNEVDGCACVPKKDEDILGELVSQMTSWEKEVTEIFSSRRIVGLDKAIHQYEEAVEKRAREAVQISDAVVCRAIADQLQKTNSRRMTSVIAAIIGQPERVVCRSVIAAQTGMVTLIEPGQEKAENIISLAVDAGDLAVINSMLELGVPSDALIRAAAFERARHPNSIGVFEFLLRRLGDILVIETLVRCDDEAIRSIGYALSMLNHVSLPAPSPAPPVQLRGRNVAL